MKNLLLLFTCALFFGSCEKTVDPPAEKQVCEICDGFAHVEQTIFTFFIPNAFTPNGDGLNDQYEFQHGWSAGYGLDSFKISDSLDEIIYSVTDQSDIDDEANIWDGIVDGEIYEGVFTIQLWYGNGNPENITRNVKAYSLPCLDQENKEYKGIGNCRPLDDISGQGVDLKSNLEGFPSC